MHAIPKIRLILILSYSVHTIKILAFGASLTEGYTQNGRVFHPYTIELGRLIGNSAQILNAGVSGQKACLEMPNRLENVVKSHTKFDKIFILAGTNDITGGNTATAIFDCLDHLASIGGPQTTLITLPEIEGSWYTKSMEKERQQLNNFIRAKFPSVFDLDSVFPQHSLDPWSKKQLWDDGIHLTPLGYDNVGRLIFQWMKSPTLLLLVQ